MRHTCASLGGAARCGAWIGSDREEETLYDYIIHVLLNVSTMRFLQGYEDLIYLSH
jgi:hypothetical protein